MAWVVYADDAELALTPYSATMSIRVPGRRSTIGEGVMTERKFWQCLECGTVHDRAVLICPCVELSSLHDENDRLRAENEKLRELVKAVLLSSGPITQEWVDAAGKLLGRE